MTEASEPTGTWTAVPWAEHPQAGTDPVPLDLTGVWRSVSRGMKPTLWDAAGMPVSASAVLLERKYLDETGRLHTDYVLNDQDNYERPVYRHAYRARSPDSGLDWYGCDPHTFYRSLDLEGRFDEYWQSRSRF